MCNNECLDFTVVLKLETVILSEAIVLIGRSVHPNTLFLGSCCGISWGEGEEDSDNLVLYVGADHFFFWGGGGQNFKFQYLLGFSRKEN